MVKLSKEEQIQKLLNKIDRMSTGAWNDSVGARQTKRYFEIRELMFKLKKLREEN